MNEINSVSVIAGFNFMNDYIKRVSKNFVIRSNAVNSEFNLSIRGLVTLRNLVRKT